MTGVSGVFCLAPQVRQTAVLLPRLGQILGQTESAGNVRQWPQVAAGNSNFVRSRDEKGKDFLKFATAMNVSAGGALVAVRRSLPHSTQVSNLRDPHGPIFSGKRAVSDFAHMCARAVRVEHADGYQLVGLRFTRPLSKQENETGKSS